MKTFFKFLFVLVLAIVSGGCCICCRSWKVNKEITNRRLPASGSYHYYTNGLMKAHTYYSSLCNSNVTIMVKDDLYKYCSNANGPWRGSDIYPVTRFVLNGLTFFSYSSAASGDYMLGGFVLITYPCWIIGLPVQCVLDTVFLPWDLIAAPSTPKGYKKVF